MKKIYYIVASVILLGGAVMSCEDELDKLWDNPNVYPTPGEDVVSGLFTNLQQSRFFRWDYGEWYYMYVSNKGMPTLMQLMAAPIGLEKQSDGTFTVDKSAISRFAGMNYGDPFQAIGAGNTEDRKQFSYFYSNMSPYSEIHEAISRAEGVDYANGVIYDYLGTVLKDIVALRTVDLFNKIPYTKAFQGTDNLFASYDDPKEIYLSAIKEFSEIADTLARWVSIPENNMSKMANSKFKKQDIFFGGNLALWVRYINAQILRACVRVSDVAGMTDELKPVLAKATRYLPQEDYSFLGKDDNNAWWGYHGDGITYRRGIYDPYAGTFMIPDVIMKRMNRGTVKYEKGTDDPRLPVIGMGFSPTGNVNDLEFYGTSGNYVKNYRDMVAGKKNIFPQSGGTSAKTLVALKDGLPDEFVQGTPWTMYNPLTYVLTEGETQTKFPLITMAEVDLLLAEVALKNLATIYNDGKSADAYMADAVTHSVNYWYAINNSSPDKYITDRTTYSELAKKILKPEKPDAAIVTQYANIIKDEFNAGGDVEGKMEIIMQQKYIHLNLHGPYELFAELRRTRHPKLEPITSYSSDAVGGDNTPKLANKTMPFERFRYPDTEAALNEEEYAKVAADDNWTTPIFWATKSGESYFRDKAIKDE